MCPFLVIRVKDITVAHSGLSPRKSPSVRNIFISLALFDKYFLHCSIVVAHDVHATLAVELGAIEKIE